MESAPRVEAGKLRDGAAGEGVDVDGVPHPRQVRHAVRGRIFLVLPCHGHHQQSELPRVNVTDFEESIPAKSTGDERRRRARGREGGLRRREVSRSLAGGTRACWLSERGAWVGLLCNGPQLHHLLRERVIGLRQRQSPASTLSIHRLPLEGRRKKAATIGNGRSNARAPLTRRRKSKVSTRPDPTPPTAGRPDPQPPSWPPPR